MQKQKYKMDITDIIDQMLEESYHTDFQTLPTESNSLVLHTYENLQHFWKKVVKS